MPPFPKAQRIPCRPWNSYEDALVIQLRTLTPPTLYSRIEKSLKALPESSGERSINAIRTRWYKLRQNIAPHLDKTEMKLLKEAVERVDKEKWNHVALEYEKMAREMEEGEVKQKVLGKINAKMFWEEARKKGEMEKAKKGDGEENKKREERDETEDRENGPEMEVKEEKDVKKKDEEEEKNFKERNFAEGEDEDQKEKGKSAIKGDSFARGLVFQIDLDTLVTGITLKTSYLPVR